MMIASLSKTIMAKKVYRAKEVYDYYSVCLTPDDLSIHILPIDTTHYLWMDKCMLVLIDQAVFITYIQSYIHRIEFGLLALRHTAIIATISIT